MLLKAGKNRIRDLIGTDASYGVWGTGTTAVTESDTALTTSVTASSAAISVSKTDKQVLIDHNLDANTAVGSTLTEFIIELNSASNPLLKKVLSGLTKLSTEQWQTTCGVFIE